ncbi:hypothetical protein Tco_0784940 [Tanacetum coccineum]
MSLSTLPKLLEGVLDPSKVTDIELTSHMIIVNNQKDLVSPLPIFGKKKKVKSQTVTPTLPKSQGPKASGALSKKRQNPKSKKTPTKTKGTRKSQPLPEGTTTDPKDSGGNIQLVDKGLPSTVSNKGTVKTTPLPKGTLGDKDSKRNKILIDMEPINPIVADLSGTGAKYQHFYSLRMNWLKKVKMMCLRLEKTWMKKLRLMKKNISPPNTDKPEPSPPYETQESYSDSSSPELKKYGNILPLTERQLDVVKDDVALNKKVIEATEVYTKNSTTLTELLTIIKNFDLQGLKSSVESLQATVLIQDKHLSSWAKSSTSMAWNLSPRMTAVESQSLTPSRNVPQITLAIIKGQTNVGGENVTHADTEEPPSHTEGEHVAMKDDSEKPESDKAEEEPTNVVLITTRTDKGKKIANNDVKSLKKVVPASKFIREDPDEPIKVPYIINAKMHHLTNDEINEYLEKEDKIMKAAKEAKRFEMTKTEVIKIFQEEAEKIGIDPKKVISAKAGV